ncbi:MAG: DUF134 domain-containing protein [Candidatus Heimdallarchaeaceae archaeon]|jgi:predicted DNA-binding protein (UPF0251 family)
MTTVKRKIERTCVFYKDNVFKPVGIPMTKLEVQELSKEEISAIYYADFVGLKQEEAAEKMGISQASFSRDLKIAHNKVACALFHGHAIQLGSESELEVISVEKEMKK